MTNPNQDGRRPLVLCRPAFACDRLPIMEFLAQIWEGEDYVPMVWDRWLGQDPGLLAVAEREGEIVGQGHLLDLGEGEWWLEGLRVRPDQQGRGLGSRLHDYFVSRWLEAEGEVVRLATHTDRVPVHKMCERTGFVRRADFVYTEASADPARRYKDLEPVDAGIDDGIDDGAIERLAHSEIATQLGGLADFGWRFAAIAPRRLRASDHAELLKWRGGEGLIYLTVERRYRGHAQVSALQAGPDELVDLLRQIRGWAGAQGLKDLTWLPPAQESYLDVAARAGFEVHQDDSLSIYERTR